MPNPAGPTRHPRRAKKESSQVCLRGELTGAALRSPTKAVSSPGYTPVLVPPSSFQCNEVRLNAPVHSTQSHWSSSGIGSSRRAASGHARWPVRGVGSRDSTRSPAARHHGRVYDSHDGSRTPQAPRRLVQNTESLTTPAAEDFHRRAQSTAHARPRSGRAAPVGYRPGSTRPKKISVRTSVSRTDCGVPSCTTRPLSRT